MPSAAPAHALLSAAHSLLRAAMHHGRDPPPPPPDSTPPPADSTPPRPQPTPDSDILLIEEATLPTDDVADLRDVVDAINKLCDTMKTSSYDLEELEELDEAEEAPAPSICAELRDACTDYAVNVATSSDAEMYNIAEEWSEPVSQNTTAECRTHETWTLPEEAYSVAEPEYRAEYCTEDWSEPAAPDALPGQAEEATSDGEPALNWEATGSEAYYTASSEVSLVSDVELPERTIEMDDSLCFGSELTDLQPLSTSVREPGEEKSAACVVAGHVAAMRERFESLTRTTTPALDHSRNVTPSPTLDQY